MKLRSLASAVVLLLTAAAAPTQIQAQSQGNIGLYLNPYFTHISDSQADPSTFSFLGPNTTSRMFWGLQGGGYYDFIHSGPLAAGFTMRFSDQHAANAGIRDFQVGARVSGSLSNNRIRPYAEVTVGDASTKPEKATVRVNKAAYAVYGGVDYGLARHLDFRAIEVGYGSVTVASGSTVGQGNGGSYPAVKLLSFSTGFVFRF
jgi:hypothetical protein